MGNTIEANEFMKFLIVEIKVAKLQRREPVAYSTCTPSTEKEPHRRPCGRAFPVKSKKIIIKIGNPFYLASRLSFGTSRRTVYFDFYNHSRFHESLSNLTLGYVYENQPSYHHLSYFINKEKVSKKKEMELQKQ